MKNLVSRLSSLLSGSKTSDPAASSRPEQIRTEAAAAPAQSDFVPQNDLERILVAAVADPAQRVAFQREVLRADLYAATPLTPEATGERNVQGGESISILSVTDADGRSWPAAFTSEARLSGLFGAGTGFMRMKGEALLSLVAAEGVVINPGQSYGVIWNAEELRSVLGQPARRTLAQDTRVMLGVPAERPDALIRDLSAALAGRSEVEEAWLALAHWPESGNWSWYLDIRSALGPDAVDPLVSDILKGADTGGKPIDVIVRAPGEEEEPAGIRIKPAETH